MYNSIRRTIDRTHLIKSATEKVPNFRAIFVQSSFAIAKYHVVQVSITPSWTGDGFGVFVGLGITELELVVVGLRATSTQYEWPTVRPVQSSLMEGFYIASDLSKRKNE